MQNRRSIILSLLFVSLCIASRSFANDPSLLPMYGGVTKSEQLKKLDADFISSAIKVAGTPQKASQELVDKGFSALMKGDADLAMRRFNQAYLLTPQSDEVRWGLAAASAARGLFDDAFKLFEDIKTSQPNNARVLNDYAYARINKALSIPQKDAAFEQLQKADDLLHHAETVDSKFDRTYFNLATIAYYRGRYEDAWKNIALCENLGGQSLDPRFVKDLNKAMPRPASLK